MSASVSIRYFGANFSSAAAIPCFTAQSLPVQRGGKGVPVTMVSRSSLPRAAAVRRATSAVPSVLSSSTSTTESAG